MYHRPIDAAYAGETWAVGPHVSSRILEMSPLSLVAMGDAVFQAIVRAYPLESIDLLSLGESDEFELGMNRIPDEVFAEIISLTYGVDAVEFLETPIEERRAYLTANGEVPVDAIDELSPYQNTVYYLCLASDESRQLSLEIAQMAPAERGGGDKTNPPEPN